MHRDCDEIAEAQSHRRHRGERNELSADGWEEEIEDSSTSLSLRGTWLSPASCGHLEPRPRGDLRTAPGLILQARSPENICASPCVPETLRPSGDGRSSTEEEADGRGRGGPAACRAPAPPQPDQPPRCFPEMDYLTFLLAVLHVYKALCEEMDWDTTVTLAENVTLECVYPLKGIVTQVEWAKIRTPKKESMVILSPVYGLVIHKPYTDRVYFLNSTMSVNDLTLSFHNATEADFGFYSCSIDAFPLGHWRKVVQVVPSDSFETNVSSNSHMVSEPGENITLTCELPMKWPTQQVRWEKIQPHQIDHLTSCNLSQGRSYPSKYRRQILSNCSVGIMRSSITIPQVVASDSGLYRCVLQPGSGENETFVIALTMTDGATSNLHVYFMAGGAVLFLFVILIVPVIFILEARRRMRNKRVQFKESWDMQNKASNNYRSPISTHHASGGAGDDIYVNYPTFSHRPRTRV